MALCNSYCSIPTGGLGEATHAFCPGAIHSFCLLMVSMSWAQVLVGIKAHPPLKIGGFGMICSIYTLRPSPTLLILVCKGLPRGGPYWGPTPIQKPCVMRINTDHQGDSSGVFQRAWFAVFFAPPPPHKRPTLGGRLVWVHLGQWTCNPTPVGGGVRPIA